MNIGVEIIIDDKDSPDTRRSVYEFYLLDQYVVLNRFMVQERATTRHKFRTVDVWDRLSSRNSTVGRPTLTESDKLRAVQAIASKIRFRNS
jgi:hypothetical protein